MSDSCFRREKVALKFTTIIQVKFRDEYLVGQNFRIIPLNRQLYTYI